jgi:hypothetical protein
MTRRLKFSTLNDLFLARKFFCSRVTAWAFQLAGTLAFPTLFGARRLFLVAEIVFAGEWDFVFLEFLSNNLAVAIAIRTFNVTSAAAMNTTLVDKQDIQSGITWIVFVSRDQKIREPPPRLVVAVSIFLDKLDVAKKFIERFQDVLRWRFEKVITS